MEARFYTYYRTLYEPKVSSSNWNSILSPSFHENQVLVP